MRAAGRLVAASTLVAAFAAGFVPAAPAAAGAVTASADQGAHAEAWAAGDARRGARFLASRQASTGAFFAAGASADGVAEVVVALVAGGVHDETVTRALGYIRAHGHKAASKPAYAGRIVMGLVAAGVDPRAFGGVDYVARIRPDAEGSYDPNLYGHALAALGLLATGERIPAAAIEHIRKHQCADGGYAYDPGCASAGNVTNALRSNVDATALVVCVLAAAGVTASDPARAEAREFLVGARNSDGGYGEYAGRETNANSTGLALSAIAAAGESPRSAPWSGGGVNPLDALRALQAPSGGIRYRAADDRVNDYATVQGVPGLGGVAYPLRPPRTSASGGRSTPPNVVSAPERPAAKPVRATPTGAASPGVTLVADEPDTVAAAERPSTARPTGATRSRETAGPAAAASVALAASAALLWRSRRWRAR